MQNFSRALLPGGLLYFINTFRLLLGVLGKSFVMVLLCVATICGCCQLPSLFPVNAKSPYCALPL